jgi:hypothetical protein
VAPFPPTTITPSLTPRPATPSFPARTDLSWFVLSLGAALTQAAQFAVVKGRARSIPPLVIVLWTQALAVAAWLAFFAVSGREFVTPGRAWPAVAASAALVAGMNALLARASARGDISVVGPVFALSPVFTVVPDAVLSGTLPTALGWLGLGLSVAGTVSLSGGAGRRLRTLFARRDALDALGAAILLGFVAAVDRWGALAMGPPSYLLCSHGATATLSAAALALSVAPRAHLRQRSSGQRAGAARTRPARRHRDRHADHRTDLGARRLRQRHPANVRARRRRPRRHNVPRARPAPPPRRRRPRVRRRRLPPVRAVGGDDQRATEVAWAPPPPTPGRTPPP